MNLKNTLSKLDGFNITIPHKRAVIRFLTEIDKGRAISRRSQHRSNSFLADRRGARQVRYKPNTLLETLLTSTNKCHIQPRT